MGSGLDVGHQQEVGDIEWVDPGLAGRLPGLGGGPVTGHSGQLAVDVDRDSGWHGDELAGGHGAHQLHRAQRQLLPGRQLHHFDMRVEPRPPHFHPVVAGEEVDRRPIGDAPRFAIDDQLRGGGNGGDGDRPDQLVAHRVKELDDFRRYLVRVQLECRLQGKQAAQVVARFHGIPLVEQGAGPVLVAGGQQPPLHVGKLLGRRAQTNGVEDIAESGD